MAGAGRFVLTLLAGLMFVSSIPYSAAQSEQPELEMVLYTELDDTYFEGDELILDVKMKNKGVTQTINNDPSCDFTSQFLIKIKI